MILRETEQIVYPPTRYEHSTFELTRPAAALRLPLWQRHPRACCAVIGCVDLAIAYAAHSAGIAAFGVAGLLAAFFWREREVNTSTRYYKFGPFFLRGDAETDRYFDTQGE